MNKKSNTKKLEIDINPPVQPVSLKSSYCRKCGQQLQNGCDGYGFVSEIDDTGFPRTGHCPNINIKRAAARPLSFYLETDLSKAFEGVSWKKFKLPVGFYSADYRKIYKDFLAMAKSKGHFKSGKGFYFHSISPGSGKTTLAALMLKTYAINHGALCQAFSTQNFFTQVYSSYDNKGRGDRRVSAENLIHYAKSADGLLLDDLGQGSLTEHKQGLLFEILDARMNAGKYTIITSNHKVSEIAGLELSSISRIHKLCSSFEFPNYEFRNPHLMEDAPEQQQSFFEKN